MPSLRTGIVLFVIALFALHLIYQLRVAIHDLGTLVALILDVSNETAWRDILNEQREFLRPLVKYGKFPFFMIVSLMTLIVLLWMIYYFYINFIKAQPSIFLSYHHSMLHEVETISSNLADRGFVVNWVRFAPQKRDHDSLLDTIYDNIESSQYFLCLPGTDESFVDSEVSAAIAHKKPILIAITDANASIPNTASKSYPILMLDLLSRCRFEPLQLWINFLHGDTATIARIIVSMSKSEVLTNRIVKIPLIVSAAIPFVLTALLFVFYGVLLVLQIILNLTTIVALFNAAKFYLFSISLLIALACISAAVTWAATYVMVVRVYALDIARRRIRSGSFGYAQFKLLFCKVPMLQELLSTLSLSEPRAHHE